MMSQKLQETLGILEDSRLLSDEELRAIPSDQYVSRPSELVPFEPKNVSTSIPESENSDLRNDYITSRNITHTLIDMTGSALSGSLKVAEESQHPKAFSVFNELASTMRLLAKDLIEMQQVYKEITKEKEAKAQIIHATQNNINVAPTTNASLSEVLRMIKATETTIIDV